jgi:hypothetical protein
LLRLVLAPASTLAGFRRWVIDECPAAPRTTTPRGRPARVTPRHADLPARHRNVTNGKPGKQDLLIALAGQRYDWTVAARP